MKFTCLSQGRGYHFPPCQLLDIAGFRVLFDCPLDLSVLSVFSPVPVENGQSFGTGTPLDDSGLIKAEPWYRTVKELHLWGVEFIDLVLISSPMGFLGLPFLTRVKGFSAKVYATEATARIGQLMMGDLVTMHMEYRQIYGPEESGFPQWMKWEELEKLPLALKEIVLGQDGAELGSWMALYSAADVKDCMQKVQALKYGEETCYNGTLLIKALSSGLEIGACSWVISSPKGIVANLSSSCLVSSTAMEFDYHALRGPDMIIYSDFSTWNSGNDVDDDTTCSGSATDNLSSVSDRDNSREASAESLLKADEGAEELEKLAFICSCSIDSIKAGGSVLIPIGRLGIILQLLEQMSVSTESSNIKVPIFFISSVAEEVLAFSNIIPEWLCKQRQEKMYSGQALFDHVELLKDKRLQLFQAVHSLDLLKSWQEPCIIFCPHWSLRLGPSVHLLRRWCGDPNSLLVTESGDHADLALLPFKPMAMKVLQCSFLDGIRLQKVQPLLNILQPKFLVLPENSRHMIPSSPNLMSTTYFSVNETLRLPKIKVNPELDIAADLSLQLQWVHLKNKGISVARLKGQLFMENGKHRIRPGNEHVTSTQTRSLMHWGNLDLELLLNSLQQVGVNGSVERSMDDTGSVSSAIVHILEPRKALIEVKATTTIITTDDEDLATIISEAICSILDGV